MSQNSFPARRRVQAPPGAPFRIAELEKQTGIPVQTIRFYVAQGLLPAPVKTSKNMGWYSALHVERLRMIQRLQRERFLPLRTIRSLVERAEEVVIDDDRIRLVRLQQRLDGLSRDRSETESSDGDAKHPGNVTAHSQTLPPLSPRERAALVALQTGSSSHAVKRAASADPDPDLARHWVRIRNSAGLSDRDAPEILEHVSRIVDDAIAHELEFMASRYQVIKPEEIEKIIDVVIPSMNKLFGLLHLRRLGQVFSVNGESGDAEPGTDKPQVPDES